MPETADRQDQAAQAQLSSRQVLVVMTGLLLGMLLAALDQTIVATALPTIAGDLHSLSKLSWIVTAYLLASTVSTPLWGKLGVPRHPGHRRRRADGGGVLLTSQGGVTYPWGSAPIITLAVLAVPFTAGFVLAERRATEPVLPLHLFKQPVFAAASAIGFVVGFAMFGALTYLPQYLQIVQGVSPTVSGLRARRQS